MRHSGFIFTAAAGVVTLSVALATTAVGSHTVVPVLTAKGSPSQLGSSRHSSTVRGHRNAADTTAFTVSGTYINESINGGAASQVFVKGMVYSPTPVGKTVSDPPSMDDPLRDGNAAIWSRDLPLLRAMGVNAIHVYNVVPPPYDEHTGPISDFLNQAWNNGNQPIYVLMSIFFPGAALDNADAARDIAGQYYDLDQKYAKYPAVMGVTISNEILDNTRWTNRSWWNNFNIVAAGAKKGFTDAGAQKLVTTSENDGIVKVASHVRIAAIYYGEQNNAPIDVWGDNVYRGSWWTEWIKDLRNSTSKPVFATEYGATAAYHPGWANQYDYNKNDPKKVGVCNPPGGPAGPLTRNVKELPDSPSANPNMGGLVNYVANNAAFLWDAYKNDGGVASGGFYFEWTDEWWKANPAKPAEFAGRHTGNEVFNGNYPGCGEDSAWYGLNAISKSGGPGVDKLTPRPTLTALQNAWAQQQTNRR